MSWRHQPTNALVMVLLQALTCMLLIQCLTSHAADTAHPQDMHLTIPWPSGIRVDHVETTPGSGAFYRFGRLQQNAVSLRPEWQPIRAVSGALSVDHCRSLISKAEKHADKKKPATGWNSTRHVDYQIRPVNDVDVGEMFGDSSEDLHALLVRLHQHVLQPMAESWGLDYEQLTIDDLFINKYSASDPNQQKLGLSPHRDKTPFSFVVPLNAAFEGGGTLFPLLEELYTPEVGAALFFSGQHLHAGRHISAGVRYVLAGFCRYGQQTGGFFPPPHPLYQAQYDGHAAEAGFRFGDLIVGLERCSMVPDEQNLSADSARHEQGQGLRLHKEIVPVEPTMPQAAWIELSQSCEKNNPGEPVTFVVRRGGGKGRKGGVKKEL